MIKGKFKRKMAIQKELAKLADKIVALEAKRDKLHREYHKIVKEEMERFK